MGRPHLVEYLLTITGYRAQFTRHEMVGRPRSTDHQFTVLQLLGSSGVTVLVLLDRFGIDQMSNIEKHAVSVNLLAAHFFFKRIEQFMDLNRKSSGFCLPLALAGCLDTQLGEVIATNGVG